MDEKDFYLEVARILGCNGHSYREFPYSKRTRWNNRAPGNGRYPGHGTVRRFSSTHVLVNLHSPRLAGLFRGERDAIAAINAALPNNHGAASVTVVDDPC